MRYSHTWIVYSSEKAQFIATYYNTDTSKNIMINQKKKPDSREHVVHESIHVKNKDSKSESMLLEVQPGVTPGGPGGFWDANGVLSLHLCADTQSCSVWDKSESCEVK